MVFLKNRMNRNGKVQNAITRLKMRHNAIIERRRKDREAAVEKKTVNEITPTTTPVKQIPPSRDLSPSDITSRLELDYVVPKSPTKKMPSVAEWLLWGDDEEVPQTPQIRPNTTIRSTKKYPSQNMRSVSQSSRQKPSRVSVSPSANTPRSQVESSLLSASFDDSQLNSHYYSEFTDDCTIDTFADMTLASSKEPGLLTHGIMAVGELFTGGQAHTPSPVKRRRPRSKSQSHHRTVSFHEEEGSVDDETSVGESLTACELPVTKERSADTATTASSAPFDEGRGEPNIVSPLATPRISMSIRRKANIKYYKRSNVNIIESDPLAVELSLEMFTRMEI